MNNATRLGSEDAPMDSFLIAQFSALGSHVDGLFDSGAQRINAYLVLAGFYFAGLQLISDVTFKQIYFLLGSAFVAIVGIWIYIATIHITIRAIQYYRIMNEIRGYFIREDELIKSKLKILPITCIEPRWSASVFDPGIILVKAIISLNVATFVGSIVYIVCISPPSIKDYLIWITMGLGGIFLPISWKLLGSYKSHLIKNKVDNNQMDYSAI